MSLVLIAPPAEIMAREDVQTALAEIARALLNSGWQINLAFELGGDAERFTLSGARD